MDDCMHCKDHDKRVAQSEMRDKKLAHSCSEIRQMRKQLSNHDQLIIHVQYIRKAVDILNNRLNTEFVTMAAFLPVRLAAYGIVGLITITVFAGLLGKVLS